VDDNARITFSDGARNAARHKIDFLPSCRWLCMGSCDETDAMLNGIIARISHTPEKFRSWQYSTSGWRLRDK